MRLVGLGALAAMLFLTGCVICPSQPQLVMVITQVPAHAAAAKSTTKKPTKPVATQFTKSHPAKATIPAMTIKKPTPPQTATNSSPDPDDSAF